VRYLTRITLNELSHQFSYEIYPANILTIKFTCWRRHVHRLVRLWVSRRSICPGWSATRRWRLFFTAERPRYSIN